jgi:drug/metabolite transporter (DMT)-like permease
MMAFETGGQAVLFGLASSAFWGTGDFTGGLATRRAAPAFVVAMVHGLSLLMVLALLLATHAGLPHSPTAIFYGLLGGAFGGIGLMAFYGGLARGAMGPMASVAAVLTALLPVMVSWAREGHAGGVKMAGFAVALAAIWLIASAPDGGHRLDARGWGLAVLSGVCFGTILTCMHLAASEGVLWSLALTRAGSLMASLPASAVLLLRGRNGTGAFQTMRRAAPLAAVCALFDTGGNAMYILASLAGRLDVAAVLSSLYPGMTILLAVWLLKEKTTRSQGAGMVLAIAAVVLISL